MGERLRRLSQTVASEKEFARFQQTVDILSYSAGDEIKNYAQEISTRFEGVFDSADIETAVVEVCSIIAISDGPDRWNRVGKFLAKKHLAVKAVDNVKAHLYHPEMYEPVFYTENQAAIPLITSVVNQALLKNNEYPMFQTQVFAGLASATTQARAIIQETEKV